LRSKCQVAPCAEKINQTQRDFIFFKNKAKQSKNSCIPERVASLGP
jgi:hypothetical protein